MHDNESVYMFLEKELNGKKHSKYKSFGVEVDNHLLYLFNLI